MIIQDIEQETKTNDSYRKVIVSGQRMQVVYMSLSMGQDIGEEVHQHTDQIIIITEGKAHVKIDTQEITAGEDSFLFIPAGSIHNVQNVGDEELKLFTIYAPPEHPDNLDLKRKAERG